MEVWQSPVYCTCLENRRTEMFREFESHRFRQIGELAELGLRQRFAKPSTSKMVHWFESNTHRQMMHKYQSGLMAWSAKPSIREFKSHLVLQMLVV
jgi:hypothetical protein